MFRYTTALSAIYCLIVPVYALMPTHAAPTTRHATSAAADIGVDWATITQSTALFAQPDRASTALVALPKNSLVFLASRTHNDGWVNVIQSTSGHQGWVLANRIAVHLTHHPQHEAAIEVLVASATEPPALTVTNASTGGVYLHLNQISEIAIPAHASKIVVVPAGIYSFNVAGAAARPLFGHKAFVNGMHFSWTFYVSTGSQQHNRVITAKERQELRQRQLEIDALAQEVAEKQRALDSQKVSMAQQEVTYQAAKSALAVKLQTLDHTNQAAVDDYYTSSDTVNAQLKEGQDAEAAYNVHVDQFNALVQQLHAKQKQLLDVANHINETR